MVVHQTSNNSRKEERKVKSGRQGGLKVGSRDGRHFALAQGRAKRGLVLLLFFVVSYWLSSLLFASSRDF